MNCPLCNKEMKETYIDTISFENKEALEQTCECECGVTYEYAYRMERYMKNGEELEIKDNSKIIEVKFNDEIPSKYDYRYFDVILENGKIETFNYHMNNPIPTEDEMIGLTWDEVIELCKKMFNDKVKELS
jgi:hypothetical protein